MRRGFVALLLTAAVLFAGLGVWQLERRQWKLALIAKVNARVHAEPAPLGALRRFDADGDTYRRVEVQGMFNHDRETLVQAVTELGPGYWVVTPLQTATGTVLVNRGFAPPERRDAVTRALGNAAGQVRITGLVRATEPGGGFLRTNSAAANHWFSRDVAAIAAARHLGTVKPFFIDADATPNPGGYPVGGLTVVAFRNAHLAYALTWFALAAASVGGAMMVWRAARN